MLCTLCKLYIYSCDVPVCLCSSNDEMISRGLSHFPYAAADLKGVVGYHNVSKDKVIKN